MWTIVAAAVLLRLPEGAARSKLGEQRRPDDAVLEAVILSATKDRSSQVCLYLSADGSYTYSEPSPALLASLRNHKPELRPASDRECVSDSQHLFIGPVHWSDDTAEVSAGDFVPSLAGRPSYYVRRNWLGKWRVKRVAPSE